MIHYLFWWQVVALVGGVAILPLLIGPRREGVPRLPHPSTARGALLLSDLFMLARTVFFSLLNYEDATGLRLLPPRFDESLGAGFIYVALVSSSAWFLLSALLRSSDRRWERLIAPPYWAFVGAVAAFIFLLLEGARLPESVYQFASPASLSVWPFACVKAAAAVVALILAVLPARPGSRPAARAAAFLAFVSQAADLAFRVDEAGYLLLIPLHYLAYFPALALLGRAERDAAAKTPHPAGDRAGRLAAGANLDASERRLLDLVLSGKGNKEIAYELGLGLSAEKHRVQKLFRKLGVSTRGELLARAFEPQAGAAAEEDRSTR